MRVGKRIRGRRVVGYGYMWWVWDGPDVVGAFEGAYSGRGAYGQDITVLPALDMVVAHKTALRPDRQTREYLPRSWRQPARCPQSADPNVPAHSAARCATAARWSSSRCQEVAGAPTPEACVRRRPAPRRLRPSRAHLA